MLSFMKSRWVAVLLVVGCGSGGPAAPQRRVRNASVAEIPGSPWAAVFVDGARFELRGPAPATGSEQPPTLVAEVTGLRTVAGARVAQLTWTGSAAAPANGPAQVVESSRGLVFAAADANDAAIAAEQASPTAWMFPTPSPAHPDFSGPEGQNVSLSQRDNAAQYCYRIEQTPCDGLCAAEICVSPDVGIVSLGGAWAPGGQLFSLATD